MASLRIAIVAGEASGDILGSSLMKAIKTRHADVQFEGIGGPLMIDEGFHSHVPMDRLSVMGLIDPLKRLPELLRIRRDIKEYFTADPPDLFLGIDSPDFTLNIEQHLREAGILTAHYVSPSVWAWRQGRIKTIAKAVDRMLTLLPFEADFYLQHNVPVTFVGHPLADQIDIDEAAQQALRSSARKSLGLDDKVNMIALLPGSRGGEVKLLGQSFIETARWCLHQRKDLKFVIPAASEQRREQLERLLEEYGKGLSIQLVDGQSHEVMAAADVVLMASGTTTLEAMLLKKPMVVAYRMAPLSYAIISRLLKSPYISLPNLLAGEQLVPELLQSEVRPEMMGPLLLDRLQNLQQREKLIQRFTELHQQLRLDASNKAAEVLMRMISKRSDKLATIPPRQALQD